MGEVALLRRAAMARVIVRMWNAEGYHKDVAVLDDQQVRMTFHGIDEAKARHLVQPIDAVRVVVDPKLFPEAVEFEVIVQR